MEVLCLDVDFALVRYQRDNFTRMIYDVLARRMIERGFPELLLDPIWKNRAFEFTENSLVLDVSRGVLMSLAAGCFVKIAYLGFSRLSDEDLVRYYGSPPQFQIDPNEQHPHGRYWIFYTNFQSMESALAAVCVELITRGLTNKSISELETDMETSIYEIFDTPRGEATVKDLYTELYSNPGRYIRAEQSLPHRLRALKEAGVKMVIVTNSYETYTNFVCSYALGREWRTLFDDVFVGTGKPGFFKEERVGTVLESGIILRGSFGEIRRKYPGATFTFIGDGFASDILASKKLGGVDTTVTILEELETERDPEFLLTKRFDGVTASDSYWMKLLEDLDTVFSPSVEQYILARNAN